MADESTVEGNDVAGSRDKRAARDEAIRSDGGDMSVTVDPWKDAVERKPVDAVDKAVIGLDSIAIDTDVVDDLSQRFTVVRSEARSADVGYEGNKGAEADVAAWKDAGAAFEGIKYAVAESSAVKMAESDVAGYKEAESDLGGAKDAVGDQGEGINDAEFDLGEKVWDVQIKHVLPDDAFTDKWAPAMVDELADKFAVVAPNPIEPIDGLVELSDPVDLDYSASSDALWADLGPGVQPLDSSDAAEPDDGDGFADV